MINMPSRFKPANTPTRHWIAGIFAFFISIFLFAWGVVAVHNRLDFIKSTSRADGVVIDQSHGKNHVSIRFITAKGEVVEYDQNGRVSYEAGEKVTVLYHADNPRNHPSTDAFGALWGGSITLFGMGTFTLLMSWLTVFKPEYININ
jgi:hypothetical protein